MATGTTETISTALGRSAEAAACARPLKSAAARAVPLTDGSATVSPEARARAMATAVRVIRVEVLLAIIVVLAAARPTATLSGAATMIIAVRVATT